VKEIIEVKSVRRGLLIVIWVCCIVQEFEEVSDVEGESPRVACSPNTDPVGHGSNARLSEMLGPAPPEVAFDAPSLPEDVAPLSAGASTYTPDPEATMTELVGFSRLGCLVRVSSGPCGYLRTMEAHCVSWNRSGCE
jgi:hypothetical protein